MMTLFIKPLAKNGPAAPGVTLIELLVVIAIIGILVVALGFSFAGWSSGYKVESQIKEIHADLMFARAKAMAKNRACFADGTSTSYRISEDTNPAPDGDGQLDAGDTVLLQKTGLRYPLILNGTMVTAIRFERTGIISNTLSLRLDYDVDSAEPDYDCVDMSLTRLGLGLWTGNACGIK